jgi:hypothetical protein
MVKSPQTRATGNDTVPGALPDTPTPRYAQSGHDFTLQAVMEMHKSVGELSAKVERLIGDVEGQSKKMDTLMHNASFIKGGIAASVVFITVIVGIASFILNTKWDALITAIKSLPK